MTKIINGQVAPLNPPLKRNSLNLKYFNILLFSLLAGLGAFYLVLINDLTVQGFALQNLSRQADNLASINMNRQEQVNVAQAYPALTARVQTLHLVAADNVEYLSASNHTLAKK